MPYLQNAAFATTWVWKRIYSSCSGGGDDIVVATGSEDLSAVDLFSGGSVDDVLVDAANKTSG